MPSPVPTHLPYRLPACPHASILWSLPPKPRLPHRVWPTSPGASESLLPLSCMLLISNRRRNSTPLDHTTHISLDKRARHTRSLVTLSASFPFRPCVSSEAPCSCRDYVFVRFGLVSPDWRRFSDCLLVVLVLLVIQGFPTSWERESAHCPQVVIWTAQLWDIPTQAQTQGPVIYNCFPKARLTKLCFQWRNFLAEGAKRFNTEEPGNRKEGRAPNHGRQGREPPAHFLFGQRSVGKDSKGLCAIFSVF